MMQEPLQLKPDIIKEITVMNSEILREIVRSKSEIQELKADRNAIKTENADVDENVLVIRIRFRIYCISWGSEGSLQYFLDQNKEPNLS